MEKQPHLKDLSRTVKNEPTSNPLASLNESLENRFRRACWMRKLPVSATVTNNASLLFIFSQKTLCMQILAEKLQSFAKKKNFCSKNGQHGIATCEQCSSSLRLDSGNTRAPGREGSWLKKTNTNPERCTLTSGCVCVYLPNIT